MHDLNRPVVSVVMTVLNESGRIKKSVNSLLNQDYDSIEIIIVDGGSTDGTWEFLQEELDINSVSVYQLESNIPEAVNFGIKRSRGKYIARMDADDNSHEDRISKQVQFLENNPEYALVGSAALMENETTGEVFEKYPPQNYETIKKELSKRNPFIHSSVLIKKSILEKVGYYNEDLDYAEDHELLIRIASEYKVSNLKLVLVKRVIRSDSISAESRNDLSTALLRARIRKDSVKRLQLPMRYYVYMILPVIGCITPDKLVKIVRWNFIHERRDL